MCRNILSACFKIILHLLQKKNTEIPLGIFFKMLKKEVRIILFGHGNFFDKGHQFGLYLIKKHIQIRHPCARLILLEHRIIRMLFISQNFTFLFFKLDKFFKHWSKERKVIFRAGFVPCLIRCRNGFIQLNHKVGRIFFLNVIILMGLIHISLFFFR